MIRKLDSLNAVSREQRRGPDGHFRYYAIATCGTCGDEGLILDHKLSGSEHAIKKFRQLGWDHRGRGANWLCPRCIVKRQAIRKGETPVAQSSDKPVVLHAVAAAPATAPDLAAPSPRTLRKIMAALEDNFDADKGSYRQDWSDRRISETCSTPMVLVAKIRDEAFGPLRGDPEILKLKAEVETMLASLANLSDRIAALEKHRAAPGGIKANG